jgi:hypothetical protein
MSTKITINLEPIITKNNETGMFTAKFADLPAMAIDETPELAILRLISILEVLLKEQRELIYDKIIKKHIEAAKNAPSPSYKLFTIHGNENEKDQFKLQLVS